MRTMGGIRYSVVSHKVCLDLSENLNRDNNYSLSHTECIKFTSVGIRIANGNSCYAFNFNGTRAAWFFNILISLSYPDDITRKINVRKDTLHIYNLQNNVSNNNELKNAIDYSNICIMYLDLFDTIVSAEES